MIADTPSSPENRALQSPRLFRVYNHYRVVIGLIIVGALMWDPIGTLKDYFYANLYQLFAIGYLCIHTFIGLLQLARVQPNMRQMLVSLTLDSLLLSGLNFTSSGLASGYSNLLVVSVAAANILIQGRLGTFFAALAALGLIGGSIGLVSLDKSGVDSIIKSGLFGILYFFTAFVIQTISRRIQVSDRLAQQRAQDIAELEKLNHQIIQRMRTGIIVADDQGQIRLINEAASELLQGLYAKESIKQLPIELRERMHQWKQYPNIRTVPFRTNRNQAPIQANFASMEKEGVREVLIFLEDTSKIAQQAQQMKLASLGRLTAGIAHEIRNPLGAISHAAQLLLESPELLQADRKMGEIIFRHCRRMNGIIENVLQLSRRKQPESELLDINHWLEQFIHDFTAAGTTKATINLDQHPSNPSGRFDPGQLAQVVTNLIGNGLRYSEQETGVSVVYVETGTTEHGLAFLDVVDEGPGISPENMDHLFEPFFTTDKQGTGLGLYLSRELCEANQAQLDCFQAETGGCRFRVTFAHPLRMT